VPLATANSQFVPESRDWYQQWALCLALGMTLAAPAAAQETAVFRSGVDLVTVDVTVVGDNGRPDATLTRDDFTLKVDGRSRRVVSAEFVRHSATADARQRQRATHFSSNEFADSGRLVVIAVDEPHIRRQEGRAAIAAAADFVDGLEPSDHVAVLGLARGGTLEFSNDRALARRRLEGLVGQGDSEFLHFNIGLSEAVEIADGGRARLAEVVLRECGRALTEYLSPARAAEEAGGGRDACPEQVEQAARGTAQYARTQARISLSALEGLIAALRELNRPTTIVLLSEGLVADPRLIDFAELAASAQAARVTIYALHMDTPLFDATQERISPTFLRDVQLRGDGVARLAGAARGAVFRLVGSDPAPFRRIADEMSGHYLIAFEPLRSERDGRVHRIEVGVTRRGPLVRARQAFRIPETVPSARAREQDLVTLLRSASSVTELPVRVATYTYVEPATADLRVAVSIEADSATSAPGGVVLGYVLVDNRGVIVASGAHRSVAGRQAFTARVPRGSYTLRVGGIDPLGRRGLVERSFIAAVRQQQDVQVSDLMLAPVPPSADEPLHPVVDRIDGEKAVAYVELSAVGGRPLTDVTVHIVVVRDDEAQTGVDVSAEVLQSGGLWARARAELPLDRLATGRYVAIAHVRNGETEIARVSRPFTVP
jgi:VWFA-related protein